MGRVKQNHKDFLELTIWEFFGARKKFGEELFSNVTKTGDGITIDATQANARMGSVVEIWTWDEAHPLTCPVGARQRLHLRVLATEDDDEQINDDE